MQTIDNREVGEIGRTITTDFLYIHYTDGRLWKEDRRTTAGQWSTVDWPTLVGLYQQYRRYGRDIVRT